MGIRAVLQGNHELEGMSITYRPVPDGDTRFPFPVNTLSHVGQVMIPLISSEEIFSLFL